MREQHEIDKGKKGIIHTISDNTHSYKHKENMNALIGVKQNVETSEITQLLTDKTEKKK